MKDKIVAICLFSAASSMAQYYADIESEPSGAAISLNGEPLYNCPKTPCRDVQFYDSRLNLSATLGEYETADTTVSITQPNQVIRIRLKQKTYNAVFSSTPSDVDLVFDDAAQCRTPCRMELKKGNVNVKASKEFYETVSKTFFVSQDGIFDIDLKPNYGTLSINPAYSDGIGQNEDWRLTIDGRPPSSDFKFLPGNHELKLTHSCYEDIKVDNFKIEKGRNVSFDMQGKLALKQGTLDLKAKRYYSSIFGFSGQASVPFSVNGRAAGETNFKGSVPLCSEIEIDSKKIEVNWEGGSAEYTHTERSRLPSIVSGVVGAAILAYGFYKNSDMENIYKKEYVVLRSDLQSNSEDSEPEFGKAWDKVESARFTRNLAYILGSVSFTLGVVLWF